MSNTKEQQNTVLQESFFNVAKDLTTLSFKNAIETIDTSYGRKGAAIQNPAVLAALIASNQDIYNNLSKEFNDRSAHGANVTELEKQVDTLTADTQVLKTHLEHVSEANREVSKKVNASRAEKVELEKQNKSLQVTISRLQEDFENDTKAYQDSLAAQSKNSALVTKELQELSTKHRNLKSNNFDLKKANGELSAQLIELKLEMGKG